MTPERLLQGPLSDAMTHAGQLAMLRRLVGSPVPPENFIVAEIDGARLGPEQADPVSPDERLARGAVDPDVADGTTMNATRRHNTRLHPTPPRRSRAAYRRG